MNEYDEMSEAQRLQAKIEKMAEAKKSEMASRAAAKKHVVAAGETLSGIALKYYGRAAKPYWRFLYEQNKDVIGDNPNIIRAGMELAIFDLPESLKK